MLLIIGTATGWGLLSAPVMGGERAAASNATELIELQGHVVCLPEAMHDLHQTELPTDHQHVYGFETTTHRFYLLLQTHMSEALFKDARVRSKELLLKGRVLPGTQIFDVSRTRSVKNGAVYDLFYFCNVCNIETVSPGPCECCQGPVELTERPLSQRHKTR